MTVTTDASVAAAPDEQQSLWARREMRLSNIVFWVALAAGVALRIFFAFSVGHLEDSDHAVVYLISKHVSEGQIDWFFWGQPYGGTLLEILAGGAMVVFGPSLAVLTIVEIAVITVAAVLLRAIATHALGRTAGNVAAMLFVFPGFVILRQSTTDGGFYNTSLCLGLLVIFLALRAPVRKSYLLWAAIGLASGLALWQSPMGAAFAAPAFVIAAVRHRSWRHVLVGVLAAIVGALPWLAEVASGTAFARQGAAPGGFHFSSVISFFTTLIPALVPVYDKPERFVVTALALAALALLVVLTIVRRSLWIGALTVGTFLCMAVIIVAANDVLTAATVRYAIYLSPAFALALAWLFTRIRFVGLFAVLLAAGLTFSQTLSYSNNLQLGTDAEFGTGYQQLESLLESQGVEAAYGEYWLAYRLTAVSNEDVIVASLNAHPYEPYDDDAAAQRRTAIVVFTDDAADTFLSTTAGLPTSTRIEDGDYTVYLFDSVVDPHSLVGAPY